MLAAIRACAKLFYGLTLLGFQTGQGLRKCRTWDAGISLKGNIRYIVFKVRSKGLIANVLESRLRHGVQKTLTFKLCTLKT